MPQPAAFTPIQRYQRISIIDILRGWALLGVVLMNYIDYYYMGLDFSKVKMDAVANVLQGISSLVFQAKSWTMLSFLFGYGFAVLMQNVANKGINPYTFFSKRMFWLFVLAIINSSFFWGDILKDYAVMGMVLLLFYRSSAKTAFIISLVLLVSIPAVQAYVNTLQQSGGMELMKPDFPLYKSGNILKVLWFGLLGTYKTEILSMGYLVTVHVVMLTCFFLGLAAQKTGFFTRLAENRKYLKRIFLISLGAALAIIGLFITMNMLKIKDPFKYYNPWYLFVLSSMVFFMSAICRLYLAGKLKALFYSLEMIGKMTLTNYMVQNFLGIFLFSGVGFSLSLGHKVHFGYYLLMALVIYIIQVYFSKWWLSKYNYGPVEWLWRQLSYGKKLPLKKASD
ncbi:DUF418 domain-containing protein [Hufsiella ginkgonis]|uniref:DUF418 domain-containing protein n=1 Tax=Hufsiella ginkgonis TaxID=2695274 RepID=A0A7K1Y312_9SPHI|nr:DUF418 domain-containing protein [Hufsiella ginkgonis]MXV17675.1 DUF418 domain-containing protein [Hufsiella ginkgonis]